MKDNSAQKIVEKIIQVARLDNASVLEIGCGDGRITSLLVGKSKELVAIDPDKNRIDSAKKMISGADFQVGTGENLLFPDECFDLVVFTLSLHHSNSDLAIREAARVLVPHGEILVIEPVIEGEVERIFSIVHDENQDKLIAQKSILKSGLTVRYSERFFAEWTFSDKEDLSQSILDYYSIPFDLNTQKQIFKQLGAKSQQVPIVLQDIMEIKILTKV